MKHWYAVYTRPRAEKKLAESLGKLGVEYYLPLLHRRKKWSDRYQWVSEPLFSSYVFVYVDIEQESGVVYRTGKVVNFVTMANQPAIIPDQDIELVRVAVEHYANFLTLKDTANLSEGDKVKIQEGPFAGKEAIVKRTLGKTIVVIAFPLINKAIEVEIPVSKLAKLDPVMLLPACSEIN